MHISQLSHTNVPLPTFLPEAWLTKGLLPALHHSPQSVSESWHWDRAHCERGSALCSWLKTRIRSQRNLSLFDRGGVLCRRKVFFVKGRRHPVSTRITLIRVDSQYHSGIVHISDRAEQRKSLVGSHVVITSLTASMYFSCSRVS